MNSCLFPPRDETGRSENRDDPEKELYLQAYQLINELNGKETRIVNEDKLPEPGGPFHECTECGLLCGGGRSGLVIDWKGRMIPCNRLEMICGFPLEEGFPSAWMRVNKAVMKWPRVPECEGCVYKKVCNNCAANMLQFAEPGKQPTAVCERTKYFVAHGVLHLPECE